MADPKQPLAAIRLSPRNGDREEPPSIDGMPPHEVLQRVYTVTMETRDTVDKINVAVISHGVSIGEMKTNYKTHEEKDDDRHSDLKQLVTSKFSELAGKIAAERASKREIREKLDSVSDELEDTKNHNLKELRRKAEMPKKVGLWALKIAGGIIVAYALHRGLSALENIPSKSAPSTTTEAK
jgi:hypothetical protein